MPNVLLLFIFNIDGVHTIYLPTGNYSCRTFKYDFQEEEKKTWGNKCRTCSHRTLLTRLYAWNHSEKFGHKWVNVCNMNTTGTKHKHRIQTHVRLSWSGSRVFLLVLNGSSAAVIWANTHSVSVQATNIHTPGYLKNNNIPLPWYLSKKTWK